MITVTGMFSSEEMKKISAEFWIRKHSLNMIVLVQSKTAKNTLKFLNLHFQNFLHVILLILLLLQDENRDKKSSTINSYGLCKLSFLYT